MVKDAALIGAAQRVEHYEIAVAAAVEVGTGEGAEPSAGVSAPQADSAAAAQIAIHVGAHVRRIRGDTVCQGTGYPCGGAAMARQTRAGVIGGWRSRAPQARAMALASAGATGLYGDSLIDLAPSGPSVVVGVGEVDLGRAGRRPAAGCGSCGTSW